MTNADPLRPSPADTAAVHEKHVSPLLEQTSYGSCGDSVRTVDFSHLPTVPIEDNDFYIMITGLKNLNYNGRKKLPQ